MKTKYIMAIGALGTTLGIGLPCIAISSGPELYPSAATEAPSVPSTYVWDGREYVGQVGGKYYYLGPGNTWFAMDQTRQQRFQEWQKNNPNWNKPGGQAMQSTRSEGAMKAQQKPSEQLNTRSAGAANAQTPREPGYIWAVWDGHEYVGQAGGKYYYLGPNDTWVPMDKAHQQRFEEWQKNNPNWNKPGAQPQSQNQNTRSEGAMGGAAMGNTRSHGPATGQYPSGQPIQVQQNTVQANPSSWSNPSQQSSHIRNTNYQGHNMGQTHPVAPPLPENYSK